MSKLQQTTICLRLFGDAIDPAQLSLLLGSSPTHGWKRHELWSDKGKGALRETGGWILDGDWAQWPDINDQVEDLFSKLTQRMDVWEGLSKAFYTDVFCGMFLAQATGQSALSPQTMKLFSDRSLGLTMKIYQRESGSTRSHYDTRYHD